MKTYVCENLTETQAVGRELWNMFGLPACIYLHGEMGAGKTSLCQSIILAAGYPGVVTSPTYNLIHEYPVPAGTIYHMDLYRLDDPSELEFLGMEDLWQNDSLFLIEWPENGQRALQVADFHLSIEPTTVDSDGQRRINFWANV